MGLFTSLYTGLSGLAVNSDMITVTGNNIANVNTAGFKGSRMTFETQFLQTLASASAPGTDSGGTNPTQVGLGVKTSAVSRDFSNGSLQPTGVNTDIAIDGQGFFVVEREGVRRYTRVGGFSLDRDFNLVNSDGFKVQGYGVDADYNVIEGVLTDVNIPLGVLSIAEATEQVNFAGNLDASGDAATTNGVLTSDAIYSDAAATTAAVAGDALTTLFDAGGTALFSTGDVITVTGATKGGATLADATFEVGATNTTGSDGNGTLLSDFLSFLDEIAGLDTSADASAGITVSAAGEIVITSNTGEANNIVFETADIIVNASSSPSLPFGWTETATSDGESVRTTFVAYDSLGTPMTIDMTATLESKDSTGTTWRYYVQSADDTDLDRVLGTGTVAFDTNGQFISTSNSTFLIDRTGTGAETPQQISVSFGGSGGGNMTALADVNSQMTAQSQDGAPLGTLTDFNVGADGTVVGIFSNSELRDLGRIVLANFSNPKGLVETGNNLFDVTVNSGTAQIVTPGQAGSGNVIGRALELSNVELSQEFINLITASTGFSASSRILSTSDRLIQELIATIR